MTPSKLAIAALAFALPLAAFAAPELHIDITSDPRQLELSPGARATLRINSPAPPVITASVGEVGPARVVGKGLYEAVYRAPAESYPQVAIIVARTVHAYGWLALPLAGTGEIVVGADASGTATVTVAGRRFGPQRAGPDGKATLRIVVPPGTRYAVSGGKRLNLNTPDAPHVFVTVGDAEVPANTSGTVALRVFAVTPEGKPRQGAPPQLSAVPGTVSPVREVEPGVYEASWSLPPSTTASVTARLEDERLGNSATVSRPNPEPQRIRIDVDRTTVTAGEGSFDFTVVLEDGAGHPVESGGPRVTVSTGAFLGWTRGPPGRWVGHLAIPERLDAPSIVIVATEGDLMARREVNLVAGPAAEIELKGDGPGGSVRKSLSAAILDRFGNPTDEKPPEATASAGTVEPPVRLSAGVYRIDYRPPLAATATSDEIRVTAGKVERTLSVDLNRRVDLPRVELGPKGGLALTSGTKGPAFGADASFWLWGQDRQLGLAFDGSWFKFSRNRTVGTGTQSLPFNSTDTYLAFTAAPAWRTALGSRVLLSASIGGGAVHVQDSSALGGQPSIDEAKWAAIGTAAVSLGARVWSGYPYVELRASYVSDPHLSALSGSFTPVFLQLGYRFDAL